MDGQFFDITVPANGTQRIYTTARYIRFLEGGAGGADTTIVFQSVGGGGKVLLKPGQAFRTDGGNSDWLISNYKNQATISGMILAGDIGFEDGRISGSVEVIDGGKARTLAGSAFIGDAYMGATADLFSHVQLWNPIGSGKNLIIESVRVGTDSVATSTGSARFHAAPLTTLIGNAPAKMAGKPASTAQWRSQAGAAPLAPLPNLLSGLVSSAGGWEKKLTEPIVVPPGYGLTVHDNVVNNSILAAMEFFEEAI